MWLQQFIINCSLANKKQVEKYFVDALKNMTENYFAVMFQVYK